jgi:hypothetical protein
MTVILIAIWMVFVGAVWAGWVSTSGHTLGILTVIVGLVVVFFEVAWPYWRRRANPQS